MTNILEIRDFFEVEQPIGTFIVAKVKASDLLSISFKEERSFNAELQEYVGNQRALKPSKVKNIQNFINTKDATFPNTIIGTLVDEFYEYDEEQKVLKIQKNKDAFKIIDGQHRLLAFDGQLCGQAFDLLVTFFLNADLNDQAYIFSIINTTQSKLDPSLVQDLTELSDITTPEKMVHTITKIFNKRTDSPWFQSIKLLGKKDETSPNGIISQYTFNKSILSYLYDKKYISEIRNVLIKNNDNREKLKDIKIDAKKYIFWDYYINSQEGFLYKILNTYFSAIKDVFSEEWCSTNSILCKTSGYSSFMKLFKDFYDYDNTKINNIDFYKEFLIEIKNKVDLENPASQLGAAGASNLYKEIKNVFDNLKREKLNNIG